MKSMTFSLRIKKFKANFKFGNHIFVGFLQDVDMVAADLTLTKDRAKALDFSPPYMSFPVTILTKFVRFIQQRNFL